MKTERQKESNRAYMKRWRAENPQKSRDRQAAFYAKHPDAMARHNKTKYAKEPPEVRIARKAKYRAKHRDAICAYHRAYRASRVAIDPSFKMMKMLRTRLSNVLRGRARADTTLGLLGCSIEEFRQYIDTKFSEGMTWENHGLWHLDHIRPCSSFDLSDYGQQRVCFHYSNFQPLWAYDNQRKHAKVFT